jgi:chaperonin cofactor prefoldin
MYALGNQSVQKAEQQDYTMSEVEDQRDYLEGQVSHWYNETMRLQTEVASLREELASRQSDEQNLK